MVGQADDILVGLCIATNMGRGHVIAAALEYMMNAYVGETSDIRAIVERIGKARDAATINREVMELIKIRRALTPSAPSPAP